MKYGNFIKEYYSNKHYVIPYEILKREFKYKLFNNFNIKKYIKIVIENNYKNYKRKYINYINIFENYAINFIAIRKIIKKYKKLSLNTDYNVPQVYYNLKYKMIKWYFKSFPYMTKNDIDFYSKNIPESMIKPLCVHCKKNIPQDSIYTNKYDKFYCYCCYKNNKMPNILFYKL